MPEPKTRMPLRTVDDLRDAEEWLFNAQKDGMIDPQSAHAMNTTLKNSVYLNVKMRLDVAKLWYSAQIKKVEIPKGMLPE